MKETIETAMIKVKNALSNCKLNNYKINYKRIDDKIEVLIVPIIKCNSCLNTFNKSNYPNDNNDELFVCKSCGRY